MNVDFYDNLITVFENYPKCRIWFFDFWHFRLDQFGIFIELLSIQNVNVARFARNVDWYFFCDFQTQCLLSKMQTKKW